MKMLYLFLAIVGAVLPYTFFIQHFSSEGVSVPGFVAALFANPATGGFTADLLFTSVVFWIFMFQRRSRENGPRPIIFIVLNLLIGLSCAFPAYLYASERKFRWKNVSEQRQQMSGLPGLTGPRPGTTPLSGW